MGGTLVYEDYLFLYNDNKIKEAQACRIKEEEANKIKQKELLKEENEQKKVNMLPIWKALDNFIYHSSAGDLCVTQILKK